MNNPAVVRSVPEVIQVLGTKRIAQLLGCRPNAVAMMKVRDKFAPNSFVILSSALEAEGKTAPPSLWGMKEPRRHVTRKSRAVIRDG